MRRPAAWSPTVLGILSGAVGVLSIGSALTPSLANRVDLVQGVLPPGLPEIARWVALAFGLALVWLAGSLSRGKRRAWQLAVVLVAGVAIAHLVKGLDAEEAGLSLALLVALVVGRKHFDVPGDPDIRPLVLNAVALGSLLGVLFLYELHESLVPDDLINVLTATATLLSFRALYLWLRSWREDETPNAHDRARARTLVENHGSDTLAYFSLRRDKSYFFSPSRRSFLAYGVFGGIALVSGDPVGDTGEFQALLQSFRAEARGRGWRVAILNASRELLPLYRGVGFRALKVGDEAVVRTADFSLDGRSIRKVRQSVSRLRRVGYTASVLGEADLTAALRTELQEVSEEWRGSWPERGFSMAMDELFGDSGTLFVIARDADGRVGGFLHLVPSPASGGYSLSAMRRLRETPNGLMEFLVVEALDWTRINGASEVSLNFCVFADLLRAGDHSLSGRLARHGLQSLDRVFQLERLLSFTGKFFPEWRPRFLCVERLSDFPLVGLAYLRAESLLTPPGPWTRLRRAA
ncbi:MAG: phosphatidylglycerol lysyltransferase domain-containing protein [Actinomycetota bacterium]